MARSARLTSIDAVHDMAVALATFGEEALAALDELDMNIRRASEWIEQDRKAFWGHEVRKGSERLSEARVELEKALTYRKMDDYTPACREERILVDKMKRRLQTADDKNRVLPHWAQKIRHAVQELNGRETQLSSWLRGDLPQAISVLEQMLLTLERYAAVVGGVATQDAARKESQKPDDTEAGETEGDNEEDRTSEDSVGEHADETGDMETIEDKANETEEPENEDMGPTHAGGQTSPSDEGPRSDQG